LAATLAVSVSLTTTDPPISASPGAFLTGADSPVRSDSSTMAIPSSTSASMGTKSFFSRSIRSPFTRAEEGVGIVSLDHPWVTTFLLTTSVSSLRRLLAVFFACCSASASESVLNQTVIRRMAATST